MNRDALAQFITSLLLSILALCATVARVAARRLGKSPLGADDYLIVASLIIAMALAILLEWAAFNAGVGQPELIAVPYIYARYWKQYVLTFVLPVLVVGLVKISVVCFYKRIFTGRRFEIMSNILIAVSVVWIVYQIIMALILKIPLSGIWDITDTHPYTYDSRAGAIQSAATDIVLDLTILAVPIPFIRNLNTTKRRKLMFGLMFGLGTFCVVATIVRLVILIGLNNGKNLTDALRNLDKVSLWAAIECYGSIIAACLPTFGPLLSRSDAARRVLGRLLDVLVMPLLTRVLPTSARLPSTDPAHGQAAMMETGDAPGPSSALQQRQRPVRQSAGRVRSSADSPPDARKWAHMAHQIGPGAADVLETVTELRGEDFEQSRSGLRRDGAGDDGHVEVRVSIERSVETHTCSHPPNVGTTRPCK